MSKSMNMLRTRRKDNNLKPNRRLDRKSSRGMIFENEELRLKTININAEVERGQSDIKKLKRENDQLRREIWYLRDEYDKLDKMLREKEEEESSPSSSTSCSSATESCSSCSEASDEVETSQNLENVQKTNLNKLQMDFDHLSIVPEENSTENSDRNSLVLPADVIKPDQSYPVFGVQEMPRHFFSPISAGKQCDVCVNDQWEPSTPGGVPYDREKLDLYGKSATDLMVKTDNRNFSTLHSHSSFSNGGNLEELLNDIETISQDILKISNAQNGNKFLEVEDCNSIQYGYGFPGPNGLDFASQIRNDAIYNSQPYKSELNVVLMPSPMPLIGLEKYKNVQRSMDSLNSRSLENLPGDTFYNRTFSQFPAPPKIPSPVPPLNTPQTANPFIFYGNYQQNGDHFNNCASDSAIKEQPPPPAPDTNSLPNPIELVTSSEHVSSENEESHKLKTSKPDDKQSEGTKTSKLNIRRKVSIHFKGKKDKTKIKSLENLTKPKTPIAEKKNSLFDIKFAEAKKSKLEAKTRGSSSDAKTPGTPELKPPSLLAVDPKTSTDSKSSSCEQKGSKSELAEPKTPVDKKVRKSSSASPERKHVHMKGDKKVHKKHRKSDRLRNRRSTISTDRFHRERSFSVCTDRSNIMDHRLGLGSSFLYDDLTTSDRERTNSLSSCDTIKARKMSNVSNFPIGGKIPWCGCWGNSCL